MSGHHKTRAGTSGEKIEFVRRAVITVRNNKSEEKKMAKKFYLTIKDFPNSGISKKFGITSYNLNSLNSNDKYIQGNPLKFSVVKPGDEYTTRFVAAMKIGQSYPAATLATVAIAVDGSIQKNTFLDFADIVITGVNVIQGQAAKQLILIDFKAEKGSYFWASVDSVSYR